MEGEKRTRMPVAERPLSANHSVLLLAGHDEALAGDLGARRPDWTVIDLEVDDSWLRGGAVGFNAPIAFIGWLPRMMSGLEMVRRLRDRPATASAHVTMIIEPGDPTARSRALAAGADDYTVAPLDAETVIARVEELRRSHRSAPGSGAGPGSQALSHGALVVDPAAYIVRQADRTVRLRRNEFDILMHFMRRPNQVLSRQALVDQIGKSGMIGERTVDRRIARLRKTLGDHAIADPIRTVYGVGYVFDAVE